MKKNKLVKFILIILFMSFLCSYIVCYSGYYEYNLNRKTTITNKKIKEFEEAIKNNQEIDKLEFFKDEEYDYTNRFSNLMYDINRKGDEIARSIIKNIFTKISKYLIED